MAPFRQGLSDVGLIEGKNVAIEYRWADSQTQRVPPLAADLVRLGVAVIVVSPNPTTIAPVKAATTTIPVIFLSGPEPVAKCLVASLNRPGSLLSVCRHGDTDMSSICRDRDLDTSSIPPQRCAEPLPDAPRLACVFIERQIIRFLQSA